MIPVKQNLNELALVWDRIKEKTSKIKMEQSRLYAMAPRKDKKDSCWQRIR